MNTPSPFTLDAAVRDGIETFLRDARPRLTHAQLADTLKLSSATRLTKYLNLHKEGATPEPDAVDVQNACRAFLRHRDRRGKLREGLFDTSVTRDVIENIRQVRRSGSMCLIHGPTGVGKTSGAELYCRDHPNAILITASSEQASARAMRNLLFEELKFERDAGGAAYPGNVSRFHWIVAILKLQERVILVDMAQRLLLGAFQWLADLHDATGTPVVFFGNPETIQTLRNSNQEMSRMTWSSVGVDKDESVIARGLIKQFAPESGDDLVEDVVAMLERAADSRRVRLRLQWCAALHTGRKGTKIATWADAFAVAGTKIPAPNQFAIKK